MPSYYRVLLYHHLRIPLSTDYQSQTFLQFLLDHKRFKKMVVIDEIHLMNDFGISFRNEFQMLKDGLFSKVKHDTPIPYCDMYRLNSNRI